MIFIVHTMPWRWVYLKMGLPDAYNESAGFAPDLRSEVAAYGLRVCRPRSDQRQLRGHARGAFTGARCARDQRFP